MLRYATKEELLEACRDEIKNGDIPYSFSRTICYKKDEKILAFAGLRKSDNYLFLKLFENDLTKREIYRGIKNGLELLLKDKGYCVVIRDDIPTSKRLLEKLGFEFYAIENNKEYWVKWERRLYL